MKLNYRNDCVTQYDIPLPLGLSCHHIDGESIQYAVREGDTLKSPAYDRKVAPQSILETNLFTGDGLPTPGQAITLPAPSPFDDQL